MKLGRDDVAFGVARASSPWRALPLHGQDARGTKRRGDGRIVALRRARRENHVQRMRPYQFRYLLTRRFDDGLEF